jgi:8-oxo-dGTP diphosphatase
MERDEDVAECMRREIREEAGIEITAMQLRGTVSWPGFGKNGEDWIGFVFLITAFEGEPATHNNEGTLEWVDVHRVVNYEIDMWAGDRYFLPMVFNDDPRQFHGVMPYSQGEPVSWRCTMI